MKITNIELKEQSDFTFMYNHQMCNVTVVSHNLTFELDVVWNSDFDNYYPEYYNFFLDVEDKIPGVVYNSIDYLLENGIPRFNSETEKVDIKEYVNEWIYVEFLRFDNHERIYSTIQGKKGNNLMFKIGDYLKYKEMKRLSNKLPSKQEVKTKVNKI